MASPAWPAHIQRTLFIPSTYQPLSPAPSQPLPGSMHVDVRILTARKKDAYPIVLIHGDFHHGGVWLNKPDGGAGWAQQLLRDGYTVYIVDLPFAGKSGLPAAGVDKAFKMSAERAMMDMTAPKVFENEKWPERMKHSQWPGVSSFPFSIQSHY
jgi:pimeloyl-ACP methyl ester carboxylesterase